MTTSDTHPEPSAQDTQVKDIPVGWDVIDTTCDQPQPSAPNAPTRA